MQKMSKALQIDDIFIIPSRFVASAGRAVGGSRLRQKEEMRIK
jgi:hypothetical protein